MNDKRNPSYRRSDGEIPSEYGKRILDVIQKLEWQSDGHRMWYTHKNPYGCWICELLQVSRELLDCIIPEGLPDIRKEYEEIHGKARDDSGTDIN